MNCVDVAAIVEGFSTGFSRTSVSINEFSETLKEFCTAAGLDCEAETSSQTIRKLQKPALEDTPISLGVLMTYSCPCCGTQYLATSGGFIPNCHNCGSVMQVIK